MNKEEFKKLLLKIAGLSLGDQKWVLKQLTQEQKKQFTFHQGYSLLSKARRFRKLPISQPPQIQNMIQLPELCKELGQKEPIYIAIILEQGQFKWESDFLRTHEQNTKIKQLLDNVVGMIKPATKATAYRQWQTQLDFVDQLETLHG